MTARQWRVLLLLLPICLAAACSRTETQCTDPLGCLEIPPKGKIVIGTILATTGDQGLIGTASLAAIQGWAGNHTLLGHPVRVDRQGTDCTVASARVAATELAIDPGMTAVIGPTCEEEKQVAQPILLDAGIPLLSPVPNAAIATQLTQQVLEAIQQVAVQEPDGTLSIPRQALIEALSVSP